MKIPITEHFELSELWSPDNGEILIDDLFFEHMALLEEMREAIGVPLRVNSGHRSRHHNAEVGGARESMHLRFATDIAPLGNTDVALTDLSNLAEALGFEGIGQYNSFLHLDRRDLIGRRPARWDKRT
tara:strand:- start:5350 stop:5733 length:384 start_codon:yes stop_codon:yes gene_type:complete